MNKDKLLTLVADVEGQKAGCERSPLLDRKVQS